MTTKTDDFIEPEKAPAAKAAAPKKPDADAPILSADEIDAIKAEAKANILKTRKAEARKHLLAEEENRLKHEEGLVTGNKHSDEIVQITVDLAQFSPCIIINSVPYWHGKTYSVPRHLADTLREIMFRTWGHQAEIDGKSKSAFYADKHVAELYKPGTKGATLSAKAA